LSGPQRFSGQNSASQCSRYPRLTKAVDCISSLAYCLRKGHAFFETYRVTIFPPRT